MRTQPLAFHEAVCRFVGLKGKNLNEEKKIQICSNSFAICPDNMHVS